MYIWRAYTRREGRQLQARARNTADARIRLSRFVISVAELVIAIHLTGCGGSKIFPRDYPSQWASLRTTTEGCETLSGTYEPTGDNAYPGDREKGLPTTFESVAFRKASALGEHSSVRLEHDRPQGRLTIVLQGRELRWPGDPMRVPGQRLSWTETLPCVNGWSELTRRSDGTSGNGESGVTKGVDITRISVAVDNSLVIQRYFDEETTFFPVIGVKQFHGTVWFRFRRIDIQQ
jgi:hypothetical protein